MDRVKKLRKLRAQPKTPTKTFPKKAGGPRVRRQQVPRAMHDKRELAVTSMFAPENQKGWGSGDMFSAQARRLRSQQDINFTPPPFDLSKIWEDPDNPGEIKPDKFMVFFGKRRTGKSFCVKTILADGRHQFPYGVVYTHTAINRDWQKHFPEDFVQDFDPVALRMFIALQKKLVDEWNRNEWMQQTINPYKVVVMDDVVGTNFRYNDEVCGFATKGRHYKCCVLLTTQYPKLVATAVRSNTDYAFIFFQKTLNEKEAIAEEYLNTVEKPAAMEFIGRHTQVEGKQREVLVVDNVQLNSVLSETTFLYEPKEPGDFVVGCLDFWKHDPRWRELCGGVIPRRSARTIDY